MVCASRFRMSMQKPLQQRFSGRGASGGGLRGRSGSGALGTPRTPTPRRRERGTSSSQNDGGRRCLGKLRLRGITRLVQGHPAGGLSGAQGGWGLRDQDCRRLQAGVLKRELLGPRLSPVGAVELAPAGHRVSDASATDGVGGLHDDEGPLFQRGHREVLRVIHRLQEAAVARPQRVLEAERLLLPAAHLGQEQGFRLPEGGLSRMFWPSWPCFLRAPGSQLLLPQIQSPDPPPPPLPRTWKPFRPTTLGFLLPGSRGLGSQLFP